MFNCLNSHQTVLHSGCLILHSYQQIFFVPSPAILLSYVVDSSFIYNAIGDVLGLISAILLFDFSFSKLFFLFSLLSWLLLYYCISLSDYLVSCAFFYCLPQKLWYVLLTYSILIQIITWITLPLVFLWLLLYHFIITHNYFVFYMSLQALFFIFTENIHFCFPTSSYLFRGF
jgi:hypothetical protein